MVDTIAINTELATNIGLEQAIVLSTIRTWHNFNLHNPSYVRGEYVWCLTSKKHLRETLPFLSDRMIQTSIEKLSEQGLITKCEKDGSKDFWLSLTKNGIALFEGGEVAIVKPEPTKKATLSVEEKRAILREKCEPFVEQYRVLSRLPAGLRLGLPRTITKPLLSPFSRPVPRRRFGRNLASPVNNTLKCTRND